MSDWLDTLTSDHRSKALALARSAAGRDARTYVGDAENDMPFVAWLTVTDRMCRRQHGFSIFDLPDFAWRQAHDDGRSPGEALTDALSEGI